MYNLPTHGESDCVFTASPYSQQKITKCAVDAVSQEGGERRIVMYTYILDTSSQQTNKTNLDKPSQ